MVIFLIVDDKKTKSKCDKKAPNDTSDAAKAGFLCIVTPTAEVTETLLHRLS
jgi:hypothetical protein